MITKNNHLYRSELFCQLDGFVICPTIISLQQQDILGFILKKQSCTLEEITAATNTNEGYLNIALRLLASQGWLDYSVNNAENSVHISANANTASVLEYLDYYKTAIKYYRRLQELLENDFEGSHVPGLEKLIDSYQQLLITAESDALSKQVLLHLEGVIVAPFVVNMGMRGLFHTYFMEAYFSPEEYHSNPKNTRVFLDFLTSIGWFSKKNNAYAFTEKGLFFAKRASAYGVTVSYLKTFLHLDSLLYDQEFITQRAKATTEVHVDRVMNVWGSGGAHAAYFKKIDEIIISIFNKPLSEQPMGILDMGCGNGAFLIHLFEIIEQRSLRGKHLETHPLFLVGADYNQAALKVTRANLISADIWAKVIEADISDPQLLNTDLTDNYGIALSELLNVRTFLDHNRIWKEPKTRATESNSTGAFSYRGKRLNNAAVEANLLEHFNRWKPYIEKHGLLIIELHGLPTKVAAANLGKTAVTAYEATHGFSDQYIVELEVFLKVLKKR
ncbi:MAG: class I SAM-dependent methyltransferase [Flavobacteriaceae bacterium]|nr:class I SAM-dependent methyltransferase [Flavobacteriaceae bacterium]